MQWTGEQKTAITARGGNLLLSAAAGSGKTTVLVERVLSLIREGANIDEMLICTFTNAAASDMRAKITQKLRDNAGEKVFREQLERIGMAKIGTLHSFCSELVREYFHLADIDPNARIADNAEMEAFCRDAFEDALDETLKHPSEGLDMLLFGRNAQDLFALTKEIYAFARTQADFRGFLESALLHPLPADDPKRLYEMEQMNRERLIDGAHLAKKLLDGCMDEDGAYRYATLAEEDLRLLEDALCLSLTELTKAKLTFGRLPATRTAVEKAYQKARDDMKHSVNDALNPTFDIEGERERLARIAPMYRALYDLVLRYSENLEAIKKKRRILTFDDLEHKSLAVLSDEGVRKSVQARFSHVFVDEYQDISDIQEAVLCRIARDDNRFMVGDVKQSIYRFRGANPELFLEKYKRYQAGEGGTMLALRSNFRSRGTVLAFVNAVFERIMTGGAAQILYDDNARLYQGAQFDGKDPKCEVLLLHKPDKHENTENEKDIQREARAAAQRILEIKRENGLRWRDFCVLARNNETLRAAEEIFSAYGIACFADVETDFFTMQEVKTVLALLRLTENRMLDEEWICALRSPVFGFTEEDLTKIRIAQPDGAFYTAIRAAMESDGEIALRLREASEKIDELCRFAMKRPIAETLEYLYRTSNLYAYVGALPSGAQRQINLDMLCTMASKYESMRSDGITGFLRYVEKKMTSLSDGVSAHALGDGDDVVHLMTVHKSKGLEYPVVVCIYMEKDPFKKSHTEKAKKDAELGIALPLPDMERGGFVRLELEQAIDKKENRLTLNEEMRLLYVALTRAKQRLILVGTANDKQSEETWRESVSEPFAEKTWLDAVMPIALTRSDLCTVTTVDAASMEASGATGANELFRQWLADPPKTDETYFDEAFAYQYPYQDEVLRPLKMTATGITREVEGPEAIPAMSERPLFMTGGSMTGAQRGTLTHALLSGVPLEKLRGKTGGALRTEIMRAKDEMLQKGILYADCGIESIARFFESDMGKRLLAAKEVRREWAFNLTMTTDEALHDGGNTRMLVQGVIDCCFLEDGQWVLMDYKTDRSSDMDALRARYAPQLAIYKKALTRITDIPVKETALCVLGNGVIISLEEEELP